MLPDSSLAQLGGAAQRPLPLLKIAFASLPVSLPALASRERTHNEFLASLKPLSKAEETDSERIHTFWAESFFFLQDQTNGQWAGKLPCTPWITLVSFATLCA